MTKIYSLNVSFNRKIIPTLSFAQKNCTEKSCYMHLDYEFHTEKQVWESVMVGH